MSTITDHIREHLLRDVVTDPIGGGDDDIARKQWNGKFEKHMRDRLSMGYYRYSVDICKGGKGSYDHIGSCIKRLQAYKATGNQEHLVDVANLCLIEFVRPSVDVEVFFEAVDDGEHTKCL